MKPNHGRGLKTETQSARTLPLKMMALSLAYLNLRHPKGRSLLFIKHANKAVTIQQKTNTTLTKAPDPVDSFWLQVRHPVCAEGGSSLLSNTTMNNISCLKKSVHCTLAPVQVDIWLLGEGNYVKPFTNFFLVCAISRQSQATGFSPHLGLK